MVSGAERHFGSWNAALKALGLSTTRIRLRHPIGYWQKARILRQIRARKKAGLPLNNSAVESGPHKDCALVGSAQRILGGWRYAIKATGLDYKKIRAD